MMLTELPPSLSFAGSSPASTGGSSTFVGPDPRPGNAAAESRINGLTGLRRPAASGFSDRSRSRRPKSEKHTRWVAFTKGCPGTATSGQARFGDHVALNEIRLLFSGTEPRL